MHAALGQLLVVATEAANQASSGGIKEFYEKVGWAFLTNCT